MSCTRKSLLNIIILLSLSTKIFSLPQSGSRGTGAQRGKPNGIPLLCEGDKNHPEATDLNIIVNVIGSGKTLEPQDIDLITALGEKIPHDFHGPMNAPFSMNVNVTGTEAGATPPSTLTASMGLAHNPPADKIPTNSQVYYCLDAVRKDLKDGNTFAKKEMLWSIYRGAINPNDGSDEDLYLLERVTHGGLRGPTGSFS